MYIEYNARGILNAFFKHQWKIIGSVAIFTLMGLYAGHSIPPAFESHGSFLIKFGLGGRPDVNMTDARRPTELSHNDRTEIMESHMGILKSRNLLQTVIEEIGLEKAYPNISGSSGNTQNAMQAAINTMSNDLKIRSNGDSNIIGLTVSHANPKTAALLVETLMSKFIIKQAEVYDTAQKSFLDSQISDMKSRLELSRHKLLEFKEEFGISTIDEEMAQLLAEKSTLSSMAFQSVSEAQDVLSKLEAKEAEMRATYNASSPVLKSLKQSIEVAREQLKARQADLNATAQEDTALSDRTKTIDERITFLETQRGRYNELQQQVLMDEQNYNYYQQRGEEARVNNLLNHENITRVTIVDHASVATGAKGPRKKLILLAFMLAGACIGVGIGLVFELIDDRISSPEQLEATLGLPVLASFKAVKGA